MSKKILFLHPNFPGQFKHVAKHFAGLGNDVQFLCQTHYNRRIKHVKLLTLKGRLGEKALNDKKLNTLQRSFKLAEQYQDAFIELDKTDWYPDIVISHSGFGCGAYVKQHWPKTHAISYVEWWFDPESVTYTYDQTNSALGLNKGGATKHWLRNAIIGLELISADKLVSPTKWQKNQLPELLKKKCTIIFDGIDKQKFKKLPFQINNSQKYKTTVTYGTRGMEPMRCFPNFIRCLPDLIHNSPKTKIQIAGNDEINYGGKPPKEGSWKKWALRYLETHGCIQNIEWMGRLNESDYISWLQNSDCHVYLTHPYIASWSLIEAMHCCRSIVASNVDPVNDFFSNDNMLLVDHRNIRSLANGILKQLGRGKKNIQKQPTPELMDSLGIDTCMKAWQRMLSVGLSVS